MSVFSHRPIEQTIMVIGLEPELLNPSSIPLDDLITMTRQIDPHKETWNEFVRSNLACQAQDEAEVAGYGAVAVPIWTPVRQYNDRFRRCADLCSKPPPARP